MMHGRDCNDELPKASCSSAFDSPIAAKKSRSDSVLPVQVFGSAYLPTGSSRQNISFSSSISQAVEQGTHHHLYQCSSSCRQTWVRQGVLPKWLAWNAKEGRFQVVFVCSVVSTSDREVIALYVPIAFLLGCHGASKGFSCYAT